VTTDYLLKDSREDTDNESIPENKASETKNIPIKKLSVSMAKEYILHRKASAKKIAFATFLCIISVIPLIILSGCTALQTYNLSEAWAGGIGFVSMLILVGVAVGIFVHTGFLHDTYKYLDGGNFDYENGVAEIVKEQQNLFRKTYVKLNVAGSCICVLSPIPVLCVAFSGNELLTVIMVGVSMLIAAVGVMLFIIGGVRDASMKRLLKEGEFEPKGAKKISPAISLRNLYWSIITAIYLAWSFTFSAWSISWVIWPVAGALLPVICYLIDVIKSKKK
jgi:hypothetical protein